MVMVYKVYACSIAWESDVEPRKMCTLLPYIVKIRRFFIVERIQDLQLIQANARDDLPQYALQRIARSNPSTSERKTK